MSQPTLHGLWRCYSKTDNDNLPGVGSAIGHHGELLQGMFRDQRGQLRRGLVTLPLPEVVTTAVFHASITDGTPEIAVRPSGKVKAKRAAKLTIEHCVDRFGASPVSGRLSCRTASESGLGMGASTSDVVAAIRAVANWYGVELALADIARLSILAEVASDSIMVEDRVVLFAQRDGVVLANLYGDMPSMIVVGCLAGGQRTVDTLTLPPAEYNADELALFERLLEDLRHGVTAGDLRLVGKVATESARINQRFLPKPELDTLAGIAAACDAVGVQVAHSGSVAGILFDAREPDGRDNVRRCVQRLSLAGIAHTQVYPTQRAMRTV